MVEGGRRNDEKCILRGDYILRTTNTGENEERRPGNLWRDFEFKFGLTPLPFNDFKGQFKVAVGLNRIYRSRGNLREKLIRKF